MDDLRWATGLLAGLSDREWRDAFRAGAYSPEQSARFIRKIHDNLLQAQRLGGAEMPIAQGKR